VAGSRTLTGVFERIAVTDHNLRVYDSTLDLLPNPDNPTPLVELTRVTGFRHARVFAKLEWYNPFGSVKDRVAANLVRDALERGDQLSNLVEPTSGNTGLGLVMVANAHGYGFSAVMSNAVPQEKRAALRIFGADVVELADDLCPMPGQPEGAMQRAAELGDRPGWRELNQYANRANPDAHYRSTGPEVWRQTQGAITHFVASLGTCGTITGTGRFLKEQNPDVKVIGVHPTEGHDIPGVRSRRALAVTEFFTPDAYDEVIEVADDDAYGMCRRLFTEESLTPGPSSGLALTGALRVIPDEPGVIAVVIFPDHAFKYTSSFRTHLPDLFPVAPTSAPARPVNPYAIHLEHAVAFARTGPDVIDVAEAKRLIDNGATLVDVREPREVAQVSIDASVRLPLPQLSEGNLAGVPVDHDTPIVTICASGVRSLYAQLLLKAQGYSSVKNLDGGIAAWISAGLPTVHAGETVGAQAQG
jgi:cysteine synthase/rhodanese-related sulfurtransferase